MAFQFEHRCVSCLLVLAVGDWEPAKHWPPHLKEAWISRRGSAPGPATPTARGKGVLRELCLQKSVQESSITKGRCPQSQ